MYDRPLASPAPSSKPQKIRLVSVGYPSDAATRFEINSDDQLTYAGQGPMYARSDAKSPGLYIVTMSSEGHVNARRHFETNRDLNQVAALNQFLDSLEPGSLIFMIAGNGAFAKTTKKTSKLLSEMGARMILNVTPSASYLLIARKGDALGPVYEQVDPAGRPISITLGPSDIRAILAPPSRQ